MSAGSNATVHQETVAQSVISATQTQADALALRLFNFDKTFLNISIKLFFFEKMKANYPTK